MYQALIRKYRRKKLLLLLMMLLFTAAVIGGGLYAYLIRPSEPADPGDMTVFLIAAALMLVFTGITAAVYIRVPHDIRRMQESIGCTGAEAFAEMLAACETLPCREERLIGNGYLFDMVSFRAYPLAEIAEIRRIPASGNSSQSEYKAAVILRDRSQCIIPSNHREIDALYSMLYEAWQRSTGNT